MGTEIKFWQIKEGSLHQLNTSLRQEGRTEPYDLEPWLASNPEIISPDILIIGKQVPSKSGPIDLLGIDKLGNPIIIELKRDRLPREALAQAIDYASDVAEWTIDKLSEVCTKYTEKSLEDFISESFPDIEVQNLNINNTQRIILIGFSVESSLERMIEWLSAHFNVNINAIILNYIKTASGEEVLAKTSIISEELEQERVKKPKKFQLSMSDDPGTYDNDTLRKLLSNYLSIQRVTNQLISIALLPALLRHNKLSRIQLKQEIIQSSANIEPSKVGYNIAAISTQLGLQYNDFLRQVIAYEYPTYLWEKDNFSLREEYKEIVEEVLEELKKPSSAG